MKADDLPKTSTEFDQLFGTEEDCQRYLFRVRWPQGFRCPRCRGTRAWINKRHLLVCSECGRQVSLTAGTVMQGSRKPLRMWLRAMWWVCAERMGGSAKGLQRLLGLGSYQTAWAWLHKLRRAMIRAAREPLVGPVEIAHAFIGGEELRGFGGQTFKKARILIGVEVRGPSRDGVGRVHIAHVRDFSAATLIPLVTEGVRTGTKVISDVWEGYAGLSGYGYVHEVRSSEGGMLAHVPQVISLLKRWLLRTHQGAVRPKQLQHYLDEFAFRFNRRKSRHVGEIFYRMLEAATSTEACAYWRLVGRSEPDRPLHEEST